MARACVVHVDVKTVHDIGATSGTCQTRLIEAM